LEEGGRGLFKDTVVWTHWGKPREIPVNLDSYLTAPWVHV